MELHLRGNLILYKDIRKQAPFCPHVPSVWIFLLCNLIPTDIVEVIYTASFHAYVLVFIMMLWSV